MPTARKGAAAVVLDGRIWVIGGSYMEHHALKTVETYDPAKNAWDSNVPGLKYARDNCTARVVDGKIYVFGGRSGHQTVAAVEMYDPAAGSWQTVSQMPTPRYGIASVVTDSAIWLIGGASGHNNSPSSVVEKYYPLEDRWEQLSAHLGIARSDPMAAVLQGQVFVFGGYFYGPLASYEKYDPDTGTWMESGNMPYGAASSGYVSLSSQAWIIGGMGQSGTMKDVQIFQQIEGGTFQWVEGPSLDMPRREAAAVVFENKIYVIGGRDSNGWKPTDKVEVLDVETGVSPEPVMPTRFVVLRNYPNPFARATTLVFELPGNDRIQLAVYDILGRKIRSLFDGLLPAGEYQFTFEDNELPDTLPSGIYFARLSGEKFHSVRKIYLLR